MSQLDKLFPYNFIVSYKTLSTHWTVVLCIYIIVKGLYPFSVMKLIWQHYNITIVVNAQFSQKGLTGDSFSYVMVDIVLYALHPINKQPCFCIYCSFWSRLHSHTFFVDLWMATHIFQNISRNYIPCSNYFVYLHLEVGSLFR